MSPPVKGYGREWIKGDMGKRGYGDGSFSPKRYRLVNVSRLMKCLRHEDDLDGFRDWYVDTLGETLATTYHVREAYWSEAFAVGDSDGISGIYDEFGFKRKKIRSADGEAPRVEDEAAIYYIEG